MGTGAATPEDAARGGIPTEYARALAVEHSPDGQRAVVLLGTNEEPYLYPYEEHCYYEEGAWFSSGGKNGPGWHTTTDFEAREGGQSNVGVATLWHEAPADAVGAVVRFHGQEREVPVSNGYFLFDSWEIPASEIEMPVLVRWVRPA